ncbi:type III secretion system inner rod subunit SctI [Pseudomonas putida]|uniref:type III secretion system inner rod subunit SctI n=1 Tax=Pseudomonas putida TaxID=303 RepID=UPI001E37E009|nr:type III secretion system inner rod subunit SctI [Pseudomonas putida]MCC9008592.1 type III secretion system inner rod subunit SctI [Pseudomonas putida]
MSVSSLGSVDLSSLQLAELARPEPGSVVSLEGRLIERFASAAVGTERDHARINALLKRPDITNPEVLSELQLLTAQYNIDVSLLNVLVRKAVSTAETLLRSS